MNRFVKAFVVGFSYTSYSMVTNLCDFVLQDEWVGGTDGDLQHALPVPAHEGVAHQAETDGDQSTARGFNSKPSLW